MTPDQVRVLGSEPSGLARMLAHVARTSLTRDPDRVRAMRGPPGTVRIDADGDRLRLELRDGELRIASDAAPAEVHITGSSTWIVAVAAAPRIGLVPNPLTPGGRRALWALVRGRVRIRGAVRGRRLLARLHALLTMDPP